MSINTLRPTELIQQRKVMSDYKNNTSDLTFESGNNNASAAAYHEIRNKKDAINFEKLAESNNYSDMLAELKLLEEDSKNDLN